MKGNELTERINQIKPFKADFTYTDEGSLIIAAVTPEEAKAGAQVMLERRVKNPEVIRVIDVSEPTPETEVEITEKPVFN